jgi:DNA-binding response OmpR family regulator
MANLMVVDDEPRVVSFLTRCLAAEGHSVSSAHDGLTALERMAERTLDLVLLDLVMPHCNGLQVLAEVAARGIPRPPIIVLSGVNEIAARVQALDRGAVDFVQKPFHSAELIARIRRHLASVPPQPSAPRGRYLVAGGLELDLDRRRARGAGFDVVLTEREFGLLAHLMRRHGDVCGKDELLHDIWGLEFDPGSNVLEVCMRRLRTKLGEAPIETIRGVGYCFYAD